MVIGIIQNNWGNLRGESVNWLGKTGFAHGFSVFESPQMGVRALQSNLIVYLKRGINTIPSIIGTYAPSSENDTKAYIDFVVKKTGIAPDKKVTINDLPNLISAIVKKEVGLSKSPGEISELLALSENFKKKVA